MVPRRSAPRRPRVDGSGSPGPACRVRVPRAVRRRRRRRSASKPAGVTVAGRDLPVTSRSIAAATQKGGMRDESESGKRRADPPRARRVLADCELEPALRERAGRVEVVCLLSALLWLRGSGGARREPACCVIACAGVPAGLLATWWLAPE